MALLARINEWVVQDKWFKDATILEIQINTFGMRPADAASLSKEQHADHFTLDAAKAKKFLNSITVGQVRKLLTFLGLEHDPSAGKQAQLAVLFNTLDAAATSANDVEAEEEKEKKDGVLTRGLLSYGLDLTKSDHLAHVEYVALTPDSTRIVVVSMSKKVLAIGEYSRQCDSAAPRHFTFKTDLITPSAFAITNEMLVGGIKQTGFLEFFSLAEATHTTRANLGTAWGQTITGIAVSPTHDVVLSCTDKDGFITCHDMEGKKALFETKRIIASAQSIAVDREGVHFAVGTCLSGKANVLLFKLCTAEQVASIANGERGPYQLTVASATVIVAQHNKDGAFKAHDISDVKKPRSLKITIGKGAETKGLSAGADPDTFCYLAQGMVYVHNRNRKPTLMETVTNSDEQGITAFGLSADSGHVAYFTQSRKLFCCALSKNGQHPTSAGVSVSSNPPTSAVTDADDTQLAGTPSKAQGKANTPAKDAHMDADDGSTHQHKKPKLLPINAPDDADAQSTQIAQVKTKLKGPPKITQAAAAAAMGVSDSELSQYLNGKATPSMTAKVSNAAVAWLGLTAAGDSKKEEAEDSEDDTPLSAKKKPKAVDQSKPLEQVAQQQQKNRFADVANEPLEMVGPITGVMKSDHLSLFDAANHSGVEDIDAHAYMAAEAGTKLAKKDPHKLDADEAGALHLYTMPSNLYPELNGLLRDRDRHKLKPFFPYLRHMLTARSKLPKYVGTLWRGVKANLSKEYPKGKEIYWWAFSSTTKELEVLTNPMFLGTSGKRTIFNIEVLSGVDVAPYSAFQGKQSEAEVLLYPGTKFTVVSNMAMGGGLFQVHLKEVLVPVQLFK